MTTSDPSSIRRTAYLLMGTIAVFCSVARIVGAESVFEPSRFKPRDGSYGSNRSKEWQAERIWPEKRPEPTPSYGSNDRSRWATIRALVEHHTYVVGQRKDWKSQTPKPEDDQGIIFEEEFRSVDKVMNPETGEFYSSKPPLMPTVLAAEYWLLRNLLGWSMKDDRWLVIPTIVLTVNVIPFIIYLALLARLLEWYGQTDFGRLFIFAIGSLGTYLITFTSTLNNHSPAVFSVLFAVYPLMKPNSGSVRDYFTAGFFAALTACLDLPAACFATGLMIPVFIARRGKAILFGLLGMSLPVAAFFASNYAALGRFTPAYSEFGGPWYEYVGSNWAKLKLAQSGVWVPGIDFAQEPRWLYCVHLLVGHHGWFSLTPVWLLALAGILRSIPEGFPDLRRLSPSSISPVWSIPLLNGLTLLCTITLVVFFVWIQKTNNYGGMTSGPRWLFWLIPLWLLGLLSALDRWSTSRVVRGLAIVLLGFSALSVYYPAWNPWRHPWIMILFERLNWTRYGI